MPVVSDHTAAVDMKISLGMPRFSITSSTFLVVTTLLSRTASVSAPWTAPARWITASQSDGSLLAISRSISGPEIMFSPLRGLMVADLATSLMCSVTKQDGSRPPSK